MNRSAVLDNPNSKAFIKIIRELMSHLKKVEDDIVFEDESEIFYSALEIELMHIQEKIFLILRELGK